MHQADATDQKRQPLARVFLRKLVLAYLLLGAVIFGVQLFAEYRNHRKQLMEGLHSLAITFAPGAAAALWDFQEDSLQYMVSGIGLQSDVVAVEIKASKGNSSFTWNSPDGARASATLREEVPLTLIDRAGVSRTVGSLTVASNEDRLWTRLRGAVFSLFQVGLALMLALGVVVWLLVRRLVVRPLLRFSKQVNALEGATALEPIQVGRTNVYEIATLQAGFNRLMQQVSEDQQRIEEHNNTLERKVAERTRDLEAANKAKGEFLARMSHEIRTPMNAVIGLSQLTLRTALSDLQRDYLQKSLGSAQALLGIINDILDFSKIEAGKLTLEQIDVSVATVLDHLFNVVGLKADEKGLTLHRNVAPDVPAHVVGDPMRLGQVLLNLVGNAIKFTAQGEVSVSVSVAQRHAQQVRLRFCVQDTGLGLTDAEVAGLFQSFHQADGSVTRRFGGTGLGLAITKQLVELMQGRVWVESKPGQGSCFYFESEFGVRDAGRTPVERRVRVADDAQARRKTDAIQGARVLLVEDNAINQLVARNFLEINGVVVDVAHNGAEGVEMALRGHYALVLMDIQMPVMDGLTAARTIRATPGFERLPIVAMTANAMATDYQNSMDAGMNDHITKPIDQNKLTATLLRWIEPLAPVAPSAMSPSTAAPLVADQLAPQAQSVVLTSLDLPQSVHLDTVRALAQLGGSAELYRNLLKAFLEAHADEADRMARALEQAQTADACRMAHTVKGTAATLGAMALSASAGVLEKKLQQDASTSNAALAEVGHQLQALCADLSAFFAARMVAKPAVLREATPAEHAALVEGLQQLAPLLLAANLQAVAVAAQLREQLALSVWAVELDALQSRVDAMDFSGAHSSVQALLTRLGVATN